MMALTQLSLRRRLCRLTLPTPEALALQRPLPDGTLKVVATGETSDTSRPHSRRAALLRNRDGGHATSISSVNKSLGGRWIWRESTSLFSKPTTRKLISYRKRCSRKAERGRSITDGVCD